MLHRYSYGDVLSAERRKGFAKKAGAILGTSSSVEHENATRVPSDGGHNKTEPDVSWYRTVGPTVQ